MAARLTESLVFGLITVELSKWPAEMNTRVLSNELADVLSTGALHTERPGKSWPSQTLPVRLVARLASLLSRSLTPSSAFKAQGLLPSRTWLRPGRLIVLGQIALGLLVAATTTLLVGDLRKHALTEAEHELHGFSLILANQAERAFDGVELVQTAVSERLQRSGLRTVEGFRQRMSGVAVYEDLRSRAGSLPQLDAITVIDADGKLLNFSRSWPAPDINVADRDYFKALKSDPRRTTFLSEPVLNRGTGTQTVFLAQKVAGADGEFLGLILGAMQLPYFEKLYGEVANGNDIAIGLFRRDGVLLARYPYVDGLIGQSFTKSGPFRDLEATGAGTLVRRQISQIDGLERVIAARALVHFPMVVTVARTVSSILADWRRQAAYLIGAAVILELVMTFVGLLMLRQFCGQRMLNEARSAKAEAETARRGAEAELSLAHEQERADRQRRLAEAKIMHMAHHDALTDLPNRVLFHRRLSEAVARSGRGETCAVLYLDLDHFKAVNDTLGHPIGDLLLREVTVRLQEQLRETDTVARLGGDEFAIVQSSADQPEAVTILAARLIEVLGAPYELDGHQVMIGTSIGIAIVPNDGDDPDQLLKNADLALYRAKAEGRGRYSFFEPAMDALMQARRTLEIDLRKALAAGEFAVFYQPLMNLQTRLVSGFEALVRWHHPERGLVSPVEFIPLAEEIGLIIPLGNWVMRQACFDAVAWPGNPKIAVNLSPVQFRSRTLVEDVAAALQASGLAAGRLELEITETVMLEDTEAILLTLHRLRDLGVSIAMDDFGTGYSSLSYLRRFPFSKVKIDRSFIEGLGQGGDCDTIVAAVADLCERLGMTSTAEGVETAEQLRLLSAGACTEAQGYLFSRPRPAAEIPSLCMKLNHAIAL
jgi:diguanylate cyclase (GGDEF)-like protein